MKKLRLDLGTVTVDSFQVGSDCCRVSGAAGHGSDGVCAFARATDACTIRCGVSDDVCDPTHPPQGTCTC